MSYLKDFQKLVKKCHNKQVLAATLEFLDSEGINNQVLGSALVGKVKTIKPVKALKKEVVKAARYSSPETVAQASTYLALALSLNLGKIKELFGKVDVKEAAAKVIALLKKIPEWTKKAKDTAAVQQVYALLQRLFNMLKNIKKIKPEDLTKRVKDIASFVPKLVGKLRPTKTATAAEEDKAGIVKKITSLVSKIIGAIKKVVSISKKGGKVALKPALMLVSVVVKLGRFILKIGDAPFKLIKKLILLIPGVGKKEIENLPAVSGPTIEMAA